MNNRGIMYTDPIACAWIYNHTCACIHTYMPTVLETTLDVCHIYFMAKMYLYYGKKVVELQMFSDNCECVCDVC